MGKSRTGEAGLCGTAPATTARSNCVLELEGQRGKLRIELQQTATAELAGLSRALWEMVS